MLWGGFILLSRHMTQYDDGNWDIRFLITSSIAILPFIWFVVAATSFPEPTENNSVMGGIAFGSLVVAVVFLFDIQPWLTTRTSFESWAETYSAVGGLRNSLGLLWVIGFSILLYWQAGRLHLVRRLGLALLLISIAYSFSRSSYIALFAVLFIYSQGHLKYRLFFIIVAGIVLTLFMPDSIWQRVEATWSAERGFDPSSATRILLWKAAINAFLANPIFGIGLNHFNDYLLRSGQMPVMQGYPIADFVFSHNYILTLFATTGFCGGILAINMFLQIIRLHNRLISVDRESSTIVQSCVLVYLICSLFGEPLFDQILLMLFLLLLTRTARSRPDRRLNGLSAQQLSIANSRRFNSITAKDYRRLKSNEA